VVFAIAFETLHVLPPAYPVSPLQVWPKESTYEEPPAFTRIGVNPPDGGGGAAAVATVTVACAVTLPALLLAVRV
jgi:hypothetical protein